MTNHESVKVAVLPNCDFCRLDDGIEKPAAVDGKTVMGPWANMCEEHYEKFGVGLGLGRGQQLVVGK